MTPTRWSYDAILCWDTLAWVAGTTTVNQCGQGATPAEALESLEICIAVSGAWELSRGRTPHELFRVHAANDTPIRCFQPTFGELRIQSPDEANEKSRRYIIAGSITREQIDGAKLGATQAGAA